MTSKAALRGGFPVLGPLVTCSSSHEARRCDQHVRCRRWKGFTLKAALDIALLSVILLFCPLTTAFIADRKGRGAVPWALIGLVLGIFGILLALIVPRSTEARV
jgi:MFS family permease